MDNSISNVSFGARIITTMQGRDKILEPVAREFERLTKDIPGDLFIEREIYSGEKSPLVTFNYRGVSFMTTELHNEISKIFNPKDKKKAAESLAKKLKYTLQALILEAKHNEKTDPIVGEIRRINKDKEVFNRAKQDVINNKIKGSKISGYDRFINNKEEELEKLRTKLIEVQESTLKKFEKIKAKGIDLETYIGKLGNVFNDEQIQAGIKVK